MKKLALLFISILALASCSKEDVLSQYQLVGKYIVVEGQYSSEKYFEIDDDNTYSFGEVDNYGTRFKETRPYAQDNDSTITIYSQKYSVKWDNDKLTLDNGLGVKYVLIKETSIPNANDWVVDVDPIYLMNTESLSTNRINDLTFYNGYVYTDGHANLSDDYVLTKINLQTLATTDIPIAPSNITTLGYENNIEYVGSNEFWVYNWGNPNDNMYEFNASTLEKTNTVQMPYQFGSVYHIGSNENEIWGSFYDDIRKYDFVGQKWGNKIELGVQLLDGLDVDQNYLYISGNGMIHKYSLNPFKAVAAYDVSMDKYRLNGFTLTYGNEIMASAYNYNTTKNEFVKITLP